MSTMADIQPVDRIGLTLFFALVAHAVAILGIAFTHDSDTSKSPEIEFINDLNLEKGLKSTTFMKVVDGNPKSWKRLVDKGFDRQFHPVLFLRQPLIVGKQIKKLAFNFFQKFTQEYKKTTSDLICLNRF